MTRCDAQRASRISQNKTRRLPVGELELARVRAHTGSVNVGRLCRLRLAGVWHNSRHTLVPELVESGAGDEVIMSIAGHVSRAMLSRYSHVRMEAKRRALDEIAARQRAAEKKRKSEAELQQQPVAAVVVH